MFFFLKKNNCSEAQFCCLCASLIAIPPVSCSVAVHLEEAKKSPHHNCSGAFSFTEPWARFCYPLAMPDVCRAWRLLPPPSLLRSSKPRSCGLTEPWGCKGAASGSESSHTQHVTKPDNFTGLVLGGLICPGPLAQCVLHRRHAYFQQHGHIAADGGARLIWST